MAGPSHISQGSLLELKAITAEHADRFAKEGKTAVRGARKPKEVAKVKDPFMRPSPGLVKRLAREARNDAKQRHFADDGSGPSDEQRRAIMEAKARKYEQMARGDYSGISERELAEAAIDFERKREEDDDWSDHSSDVDESAVAAKPRWADDDAFDTMDDLEKVEYVDEMGRTRTGTRKEARKAEREKQRGRGAREEEPLVDPGASSSYAEVQQSNVIHGEQSFFPVYEPDPDVLKRKYLEAEKEARAHHYDSTKEVRVRGAGAYQFSLDDDVRAQQMASLEAERAETERQRASNLGRTLSAAQEAKKRKVDERRALVEAKRAKLLGGSEKVAALRAEKQAKEADKFLENLEHELRRSQSPIKGQSSK